VAPNPPPDGIGIDNFMRLLYAGLPGFLRHLLEIGAISTMYERLRPLMQSTDVEDPAIALRIGGRIILLGAYALRRDKSPSFKIPTAPRQSEATAGNQGHHEGSRDSRLFYPT
jgi:hypothetical protein